MIINKIKDWYRSLNKKANEDLYILVLLWAHDKQETGFTWDELKTHFTLNSTQEAWVKKIFLTTSDQDRKFFEYLRNDETITPNKHYYSLNEKGITAAINYKSLAHAERASSLAIWFAALSILLTAIGIFFQIKQTNLTEVQVIPEQINQAKAKQRAIEFCKQNPNDPNSGLYFLDGSGKMATCQETLKAYK
jgi:hypothetical protein